jgi:hypothetical protein
MEKLTIVWQRARSSVWEDGWIEYLFRNIPHDTVENLDHNTYIDNSVIVDALCWAPYHNDYIAEMTARNYNFGLIHLTDEDCKTDISSYNQCKFVLRNYYRGPMPEHVMNIPLGWNTGFTDFCNNKSSSDRKFVWACVAARWDQNRNDMVKAMSTVAGGSLYVADHHGPRLTPAQMSEQYHDAIFIPCPQGAIIVDSFRITEALEAGCIPIVERSDYWTNMHGDDFPAIQIDSWAEAPAIIAELLTSPSKVEAIRLMCSIWWESRKHKVTSDVTKLIHKKMY